MKNASLRNLLCIPGLLLALIFLWLHWDARQPYDGDAMCFMPNAAYFSADKGLVNPLYDRAVSYSESADGRLIWHGFSGWMLVGWLAPTADYFGVFKVFAMLGALSIILFTLCMVTLTVRRNISLLHKILWSAVTPFCAASLLDNNGRPESLLILYLSCGLMAEIFLNRSFAIGLLQGVLFAFAFTTTPIAAGITGLTYLLYLTISLPPKELLCRLRDVVTGGTVTLFILFWAYPYTFGEWVSGLKKHSEVVTDYHGARHLYYWFQVLPLLGMTLIVGLGCIFTAILRIKEFSLKVTAYALFFFLALSILYFAPDARFYNSFGLILLIPPLMLWFYKPRQSPRLHLLQAVSVPLLFIPMSLPFLIMTYIAVLVPSEVSMADLSEVMSECQKKGSVAVSTGLFATANIQHKPVHIIRGNLEKIDSDYIFIQQINPTKECPPEIPGYSLSLDSFSKTTISLFGLKFIKSPRDYSYALYRRASNDRDE